MSFDLDEIVDRAKAHIAAKGDEGKHQVEQRAIYFECCLHAAIARGDTQALDRIKPGIDAMMARAAIAALHELCI